MDLTNLWTNWKCSNTFKTNGYIIYCCENDDFEKHGYVFHLCKSCIGIISISKSHFHILYVKHKWPLYEVHNVVAHLVSQMLKYNVAFSIIKLWKIYMPKAVLFPKASLRNSYHSNR